MHKNNLLLKSFFVWMLLFAFILSLTGCNGVASPLSGHGGREMSREDALSKSDVKPAAGDYYLDSVSGDVSGVEDGTTEPKDNSQYTAGTLTAGEWRDLSNWEFWTKLIRNNDYFSLAQGWNMIPVNRFSVTALNGDKPAVNVQFSLQNPNGQTVWTARTDYSGTAYLFSNLSDGAKNGFAGYTLTGPNGTITLDQETDLILQLDAFEAKMLALDFALLIDTTGSMSDELSYLQKELKNVLKRVQELGVTDLHVSVSFYRDEGDDYVVLANDFTDDMQAVQDKLAKESADGGGDYPEAVHTALDKVMKLSWRENSVKLLYLVLDAPAHRDVPGVNDSLLQSMTTAADKGIRIIPVASSGVDKSTEIMLRDFAVLTGGTYVFLTDDSGYGNSHIEPTIGDYAVEKLNDLMVRVTMKYYGLDAPDPVPTVKNPVPEITSGFTFAYDETQWDITDEDTIKELNGLLHNWVPADHYIPQDQLIDSAVIFQYTCDGFTIGLTWEIADNGYCHGTYNGRPCFFPGQMLEFSKQLYQANMPTQTED